MPTFDSQMTRIYSATGTRTQVELAAVLGVQQPSISDAKRRKSIPSGWFETLIEKYGLGLRWLKYGEGPMYPGAQEEGYRTALERIIESSPTAGSIIAQSALDAANKAEPIVWHGDIKYGKVWKEAILDDRTERGDAAGYRKALERIIESSPTAGSIIAQSALDAAGEPIVWHGECDPQDIPRNLADLLAEVEQMAGCPCSIITQKEEDPWPGFEQDRLDALESRVEALESRRVDPEKAEEDFKARTWNGIVKTFRYDNPDLG